MNHDRDQLLELLALRSTEGLSGAESAQVAELMTQHPEIDSESFEYAAAAVHLALLGPETPLPREVEGRLLEAGERFIATEMRGESQSTVARRRALAHLERGWWVAAAILVLAVIGWWPRMRPQARPATPEVSTVAAPTLETLVTAPGTVRLPWTTTDDATAIGASGEVVWNNERQSGFMRFTGLEVNDPSDYQYQLWIFDRTRDERYPVDGGVFDVGAPGEVVVPIDARIRVGEPYLFAVTVEPPGGVVVSSRERIALTAQPS